MDNPITVQSADQQTPAVSAENTGSGTGVSAHASGQAGTGVLAFASSTGVNAFGDIIGVFAHSNSGRGILATSESNFAVHGVSKTAPAVQGESDDMPGLLGISLRGPCVQGKFNTGGNSHTMGFLAGSDPEFNQLAGVYGQSDQQGVMGITTSGSGTGVYGSSTDPGAIGIRGESTSGVGVQGHSFDSGIGVNGISHVGTGVHGINGNGAIAKPTVGSGVWGESDGGNGVSGISQSNIGIFGKGGFLAGRFEGDVEVTGDIRLINADCAEDFDISGVEKIEPGTVMVLNQEGALQQSHKAYDKRVAGVISGAGDFKPAIVLDKQQSQGNRMPIALMGKVNCKVDAQYASIEVGDLLTTSPTLGHGMKAGNPLEAFGSVIGKALRPLKAGQGMIPILIALQ